LKREIVTIGIPLVVIGGFVLAVWGFNALVFYFVLVLAMISSALALLDWLRLKRGCVITRDKVIDFALLVVFLILALCVTVWFLQLNLEYQVWRTRFPMAIEPWQTNLPRYLLWIPMILLWGLVCKWANRVL
jgi:hypothetical protein